MANLETAISVARRAHEGQIRKISGAPYIVHPLWVMRALRAAGYSELTQTVGVLHDVLEDCSDISADYLRKLGYSDEVLSPLLLITKDESLDYQGNIERLAPNPRARAVKRFDLMHNMDLCTNPNPSVKDIARTHKYGRALTYLSTFGFPTV